MAATARKYNPGFLSDDELMASFCVRIHEFASVVEMLRECTGRSNTHQIVIGPRGSGKTSLLLRVAVEIHREPDLQASFFPVVFAEESYEVATAGEFWLECLAHLAAQAPREEGDPDLHRTFEDLRRIRDDRTLGDRCLGALQDFSDLKGKRLVLLVENLNMMFRDMSDPDAGWRLRKVLQTEPRIILLASATSRFDEIADPKHALYEQLRILPLRPLDTNECAVLWETVSGRLPPPETIRSLEILTGGSPRLITIVARFGAELSFRKLMASLLDLIDDHTEYFKSHLESLAAQERRVYLALAALWKPATTREIADYARTDTSKCSAQLTRLVERGIVQTAGGSARRKQYYLTERLYNIYYLLRRSRRSDRLVEALIRFMESYYSPSELKDIGVRIVREAEDFSGEMKSLHGAAFAQLLGLPALSEHREELLAMIPKGFMEDAYKGFSLADMGGKPKDIAGPIDHRKEVRYTNTDENIELAAATALFSELVEMADRNQIEDLLITCDEMEHRFGESRTPAVLQLVAMALVGKGTKLGTLDRAKEALVVCDKLIHRFGTWEAPAFRESVAMALAVKGSLLGLENQPEQALATYNELLLRFGAHETPTVLSLVATALAAKTSILHGINRSEDALAACEEVVSRFTESETLDLLVQVAQALVNKGALLGELERPEEAVVAFDEVVRQFGENDAPPLLESVAVAIFNKGAALFKLNRVEDALAVLDEVVRRFGQSDSPTILEVVAKALVTKGGKLGELNRVEDSLATCDEVLARFGENDAPAIIEQVAMALCNKGAALSRLNRPEDALEAYEEVIRRVGQGDAHNILELAATSLVNKGAILGELNQVEDSLAACDEVVNRFGESDSPAIVGQVAAALINKGITLTRLNRKEKALDAYREVVDRVGLSEDPALRSITRHAILTKAELETKYELYTTAVETADRALNLLSTESPETRVRAHMVRARATLAGGDPSACVGDVEAVLALLATTSSVPKNYLDTLVVFSGAFGPERMCELIKVSPSADLLLPLTTALELELGLEPRVAQEVIEVAEDIRRDLAKLREAGTGGSDEETLDGAESADSERNDA